MATKIQLRRDTAANWAAENPVLSEGELGYDTTNAKAKVGDGVQGWDTLPFITDSASSALIPGDDVSELNNDAGYITPTALTGYATETYVNSQGFITTAPDLTGYATETYVNSQGFLTTHQDISSKADITYVDAQVANLVDAAPGTLDTLNELAAALGDDPDFATTITTSIGTKWTQDNTKISNWDTAYSWGDHSTAGYLSNVGFADLTDKTITDYKQAIHDLGSVSGSVSIDKDNGSVQKLTSSGSISVSHNLDAGQTLNLIVAFSGSFGTMTVSGGLFADGDNQLKSSYTIATLFYDGTNTFVALSPGYVAV